MSEHNARHLDATVESSTQWPEAVREYEKLKEESAPPLGHMLRTADAAIEALKAEVERLRWMLATLIEDFDCAEMVDDYVADLAARYEREHGDAK